MKVSPTREQIGAAADLLVMLALGLLLFLARRRARAAEAAAERLAGLLAHEKARQPILPPPGYEARPAGPDAIDVANLVTEHDGWRRAALTAGTKLEESTQAQAQMIMDLAGALGHGESTEPVAWTDLVAEAAQLHAARR